MNKIKEESTIDIGSKDSYDTIGLDDDKVIVGAQKIKLSDSENSYSNVSNNSEKKMGEDNKNTIQNNTNTNANSSWGKNLFDKIKNYLKKSTDNNPSTTSTDPNNNSEKDVKIVQNNENINNSDNNNNVTCKQKLIKKLEESIEVEKSYKTFGIMLAVGLVIICISLTVFLPFIVAGPSKFVTFFATGSIIVLISFIFVYGTKAYFEMLFSKHRFVFSILYLLSIFMGFYFASGGHYFLCLLCAVFQIISLIIFTLSFIPGGTGGISCIKRALTSPFASLWMRIRGRSYLPS
jgi:hypothetical protein